MPDPLEGATPSFFRFPSDVHSVNELAASFAGGHPFPHVVIDDAIEGAPEAILAGFPGHEWSGWGSFHDAYQPQKKQCGDITMIPYPLRDMIVELQSPPFLQFLEQVSGIPALLVDPYLRGGGLHLSGPGGILAPHTDFHLYTKLQISRRINVLLYLNDTWSADYGGCLELYSHANHETPACEIVPAWGRCVIFRTDDRSVHGFSRPIVGDHWRRSVALYYYTAVESQQFSGDETTYFRQHSSVKGLQRARLAAYRTLLSGSRVLSLAAHGINPNRRPPKEG